MRLPDRPKTVSAERLSGGVHIAFSDGKEGFYSDEVLLRLLPEAQQLLAQQLGEQASPQNPQDRSTGLAGGRSKAP
jgi:hypothetical protein